MGVHSWRESHLVNSSSAATGSATFLGDGATEIIVGCEADGGTPTWTLSRITNDGESVYKTVQSEAGTQSASFTIDGVDALAYRYRIAWTSNTGNIDVFVTWRTY